MRRAALTIVSTITGLVLLLSFKTHSTAVAAKPAVVVETPATTTTTAPATTTSGTTASSGTKTVTGDSVDTRWGPVQVKITVTDGKITSAQAVDYPQNNGRDQEINAYAVPVLEKETVAASSANISAVSGATYTSDGYIQSLQSALDKV